jgi:hypothetical protein
VNGEGRSISSGSTDRSAIWACLFRFVGIWSVLELLGLAIFPAANAGAKVELGIWSVILTAIALFIAGTQTGSSARLSGRNVSGRNDGARHGMIMFGLSLTGEAQHVESTSRLVNDAVITEYINRVGQNLVRNSDSQVPFTIKVIDSDDINAFALPGGFFYVDSGLILAADNAAEWHTRLHTWQPAMRPAKTHEAS